MRTVSLREKETYKTIAGLFYGFPFREAELQTHRPQGDTTTLGAKGPVKLKNPWAEGPSILRTFPFTTRRRQAATTLGRKAR